MLLMLILIGVSSCSNEDENIGNIPSQLIKTWYMGEGTYITFNADGTGVYTETDEISTAKLMRRTGTRATDTYSFTYSYEESTQTLTIHIDGDVMRWTIVTLTDDTLKIKDEEGELITLKKMPLQNRILTLPCYTIPGFRKHKISIPSIMMVTELTRLKKKHQQTISPMNMMKPTNCLHSIV